MLFRLANALEVPASAIIAEMENFEMIPEDEN